MRILHSVVIPLLVVGVAANSTLQRREDAAGGSIEVTDSLGTSNDAVNVGNVDNVENVDGIQSPDGFENVDAADDVRLNLNSYKKD
jgi:hypothetical protein